MSMDDIRASRARIINARINKGEKRMDRFIDRVRALEVRCDRLMTLLLEQIK